MGNKPGLDETMLEYCPTWGGRRGAAPASQVFVKFRVNGGCKKNKTTFFHFKSTINRKQSRVLFVKSAVRLAPRLRPSLFTSSSPGVSTCACPHPGED